jgi:hypothetical protein
VIEMIRASWWDVPARAWPVPLAPTTAAVAVVASEAPTMTPVRYFIRRPNIPACASAFVDLSPERIAPKSAEQP